MAGMCSTSLESDACITYTLAALAIAIAVLLTALELGFRCRDRALAAPSRPKSSFTSSALSGVPQLLPKLLSYVRRGIGGGALPPPITGQAGERYAWLNDRPTPGNRFLGLVGDVGGASKSLV